MTPPLVLVDTNILLSATDRSRSLHTAAQHFLGSDPRRLATCPQITREYLAVATRPTSANGLGLPVTDAVENLEQLLNLMTQLPETPETTALAMRLIRDFSCRGKQVHDANLAAIALAHHVSAIATDNTRHFARFTPVIAVEELA